MPSDSNHTAANLSPVKLWRQLIPLFVCTAAWGLVTVMLGPLLPALTARWHIQDAQAGSLFTASFLGQLTGAWFASRNLRLSLLLGAALTAAGTAALAWCGFPAAHIALFAAGVGIAAGLTAGNVVAGTSTPYRARTLALFNVSWSIGAIACPALIHLCGPSNTPRFFLVTATIVALCGVFAATLPRSFTAPRTVLTTATPSRIPLPPLLLALFALSMLLYIGNENSLGGWLPSFAIRNDPLLQASTIALLYWLSELISRLLMAAALDRISEAVLYRACLAILIATQAALLLTPHPQAPLLIAASILTGIAIGPLYPLIVASLLSRTGNHPRLGSLFALASFGGASLPWLTGIISTHFGGLRAGLLVPAAGITLMLLLSPAILPAPPSIATSSE
jgi:fucose permease